jgi:MFS family permease
MSDHHHKRKQRHHELLRHIDKRNFTLGVWNGVLYNLGKSFISQTTVLPAFLSHLTTSSSLIGFISSFESVGWYLLQLPVSAWIIHRQRKMPMYRLSALIRTLAFTFLAVITLATDDRTVLLISSVTALLTFYLASGPGGIVFMELYAKAIPARKRGQFLALRMAIGGILSASVGALFINLMLNNFTYPHNFGLIFTAGTIVTATGLFLMAVMREPRDFIRPEQRTIFEQFARSFSILRTDKRFRTYIKSRLMFELFSLGLPFLFLFAHRELGFSVEDIGLFIAVECLGIVFSNYIWAKIADNRSNRRVLIGSSIVALGVPIMVLLFSGIALPKQLFAVVFFLTASVDSGKTIGGMGYLIDIIPQQERTTYSALYNTLLALPVLLVTVGGILLDSFGFVFYYSLILLISITTLITLIRLEEPHHAEI